MKHITADIFWEKFNSIHLYQSKGESCFKIAAISFSWRWSVFMEKIPDQITREMGIALHLFSLALIMEYIMRLIGTKKFIPKILPGLLCIFNVYIFITAAFMVGGSSTTYLEYTRLYDLTFVSMVILWIDLGVQLFIEKANINIENKLSNVYIGD